MPQDIVVEVKNLKKYYNDLHAVDDISFSVSKGEIFGILGPNGAGKSTTIELIVGMKDRLSGEIQVLGKDPRKDLKFIRQKVGVQLQAVTLFRKLTVKEVLRLFSSFYEKPMEIAGLISKFELEEKENTYLEKLSGGQAQRVGIALAVIGNGEIIFLDEPTNGLDPQSRQKLWDIIRSLRDEGKTIFITTHYMEEAQQLCDRIAIIDHGKIVTMGTTEELVASCFSETSIEFESEQEEVNKVDEAFLKLPGVTNVFHHNHVTAIKTNDVEATIGELFTLTKQLGISLSDFKVRKANLEDVFLKLTGRRIRE